MVRFIIKSLILQSRGFGKIYIPIWLDLLWTGEDLLRVNYDNLHSNMVRFIIHKLDKEQKILPNLHSNMVRFIMRIKRLYRAIISNIYIPIWLDLLYKNKLKYIMCGE